MILDSDDRRKLRDLLQKRGVYVAKGRNILIFDALYDVFKNDIPRLSDEKRDDLEETEHDKGIKAEEGNDEKNNIMTSNNRAQKDTQQNNNQVRWYKLKDNSKG